MLRVRCACCGAPCRVCIGAVCATVVLVYTRAGSRGPARRPVALTVLYRDARTHARTHTHFPSQCPLLDSARTALRPLKDPRTETVMLPIRDGLLIVRVV